MRNLLVFVLFLLLTATAFAADLKLAWDPAPAGEEWTSVRIYEQNGANYSKVGEVAGNVTEITLTGVTPGRHVYVARSFSAVWNIESGDSNQAISPNLNTPPKGLRIVTVGGTTLAAPAAPRIR